MLLARGKSLWRTTDFLILDRTGVRAELTLDSGLEFKLCIDTQEYVIDWTPTEVSSELYGERIVTLSKAGTLMLAAYGYRRGWGANEYRVPFAGIVYSARYPWFGNYTVRAEDSVIGKIAFRDWDPKRRFLIYLPSELPLFLRIFLFHLVWRWF